jgi:hypothetical protein
MRTVTKLMATAAAALLAGACGSPCAAASAGELAATDYSAPLGSPSHPIPKDSPTPADLAYRLKAGDPNVVSNARVADTPQNRTDFGQPLSRRGRASTASGD